jgi:hypothetical protein
VQHPVSVVTLSMKNCGFFLDKDEVLRCHCDKTSQAKMDDTALTVHIIMKKQL